MPSLRIRALVTFVFAGLGWLLAVFLTAGALLLLPVEAEDDPRFLNAMVATWAVLIAAGAFLGWRRSGRLH